MNRALILVAVVACAKSEPDQPPEKERPVRYELVDHLVVDPSASLDRDLKVNGFVAAGSIEARIVHDRSEHRFVLESKDQRLAVRITGPIPDTFKERAQVVVSGRLAKQADGSLLLEGTEIATKCPSKYDTPTGGGSATKFR